MHFSINIITSKLFGNIDKAVTIFSTSMPVLFSVHCINLFYFILSMRKLFGKFFCARVFAIAASQKETSLINVFV